MGKLEGKTALVTGAGRGIGKMIALVLADEGAQLVINDIDPETAGNLSARIESSGGKAIACPSDISDRQQVKEMFSTAVQKFNTVDILVNNAGITRDNLFTNMTEKEWDMVMDINLKGVFNCSQQAAALMQEKNYGKIINITSIAAQIGNVGQTNYSASKAGVIGMTKTLAKELARYHITVNAVAPGFIETPMTRTIPEKVKSMMIAAIPLGRAGKPEDIANLVKFLSTDESDYITGQVISCNGGLYI